jgi:hypothetical protein
MKKLVPVFAFLLACATPAFAGPCVALEYQEMKDMSADELAAAACKAREANKENFNEAMTNIDTRRGPKPYPNAESNQDQCNGQIERILRILKAKGVSEKLHELCAQQAAGQTITAPAEAK